MYKYGKIEDAVVGDVVEATMSDDEVTRGKLYVILEGSENDSGLHYIDDKGIKSSGFGKISSFWKLVLTKPISEAVKGDTVIRVSNIEESTSKIGETQTFGGYKNRDYKVLCKKEEFTYPMWFQHDEGNKYKYTSLTTCISLQTDVEHRNTTPHTHKCMTQIDEPDVNPFKKGDVVRRTKDDKGAVYTVYEIDGDDVYYMDGLASHYKNWGLVEKQSRPKSQHLFGEAVDFMPYVNAEALKASQSWKSNQKENTMKNTDIKIEINGESIDLCNNKELPYDSRTELEARSKIQGIIFSQNGDYEGRIAAKNMKRMNKLVKQFLAQTKNIGKTVVISQDIQTVTTKTPLVTTKV